MLSLEEIVSVLLEETGRESAYLCPGPVSQEGSQQYLGAVTEHLWHTAALSIHGWLCAG